MLKIVRNDITKMEMEAIVNTANSRVEVGPGCDYAVYTAAGMAELLAYRREHIGEMAAGNAFITPGYNLPAKYIIHTVSPLYKGGEDEENILRSCYQSSLQLAKENKIQSIAFPLIATGGFRYPKEEGIRIAVDEINAFLLDNDMEIYLVVFDEKGTNLGGKLYPNLEAYIDQNYVSAKKTEEYGGFGAGAGLKGRMLMGQAMPRVLASETLFKTHKKKQKRDEAIVEATCSNAIEADSIEDSAVAECTSDFDYELHDSKLKERLAHRSDSFSEYLMYLISEKNMDNADVWKRAIVDRKVFSKIKNNPDYHPQKRTAMCLCIGAMLNYDEAKDLLARAGYAFSPYEIEDLIFSFYLENGIYDMMQLDIDLEEHGVPCIIS